MEKQEKKNSEPELKEDAKIKEQENEEENSVELEEELDFEQMVVVLKEQNDDLQDKLLRQMAESQNIRTRSQKMQDEARDYAIFSFAKDLVQVMDNLTMSLQHVPENMDENIKSIIDGVKMTKNELENVFARNGMQKVAPEEGDKFDYNLHNAISQVETEEYKPGSVVGTMQSGYKIKERLIRPAAVTVAKGK